MIRSLHIQNYAIIDNLEIDFRDGLTAVTGETGAGKSIILGALSLILGERIDSKLFKDNEAKCVVEAEFDISSYRLTSFFTDNELEYDGDSCIIRREVQPNGKSRAFVNDSPTSLTVLKMLSDRLIDIHSQHQNLLLSDSDYQLKVLDWLIEDTSVLQNYKQTFGRYKQIRNELNKLRQDEKQARSDEEFLRFQYTQLSDARLVSGEQEELEEELKELSHVEEIKRGLYKTEHLLSGDEVGLLPALKEAVNTLQEVVRVFPKLEEAAQRMESCYIELADISSDCCSHSERIEYDPARIEWINDRLNVIYSLQQKHHLKSVDELIALRQEMEEKLNAIDNFDQTIDELTARMESALKETMRCADILRIERKKQADVLTLFIVSQVKQLAIPNIRFEVRFIEREEPTEQGIDEVEYLFAANKNAPLLPVVDTASGGEISRIMLCVKALIAGSTSLPTIIFDEIDTGVSGEVADMMGNIMCEMGKNMQVITITHLPQIAAKGQSHFKVYKYDTENTTQTTIVPLNKEERVMEIARMLSGSSLTDAAIENAKQLLNSH